jgi:hypothetical protein
MKLEDVVNRCKDLGLTFEYAPHSESIRCSKHVTGSGTMLSPLACVVKLYLLNQGKPYDKVSNLNVVDYAEVLQMTEQDVRNWFTVEDIEELRVKFGSLEIEEHKKLRAELLTLTKGKKPSKKKAPDNGE